MLALHQKANPELTKAKEIKVLDFMGAVHQKPSTSARAVGYVLATALAALSPAQETSLQKPFVSAETINNIPPTRERSHHPRDAQVTC